jgi:hypothetical protein
VTFVNYRGEVLELRPVAPKRTLKAAKVEGERAMHLCLDKAKRSLPDFAERAEQAILEHLRAKGQCSGEELVEVARAKGAIARDGRAFGPVFQVLLRRGLIVCLRSDLPRRHGHGTSGGKLYALAH